MASQTLAHINPEVLRWARTSMGYSLEAAAHEIGFTGAWRLQIVEEGAEYLTLREAEKAAKAYERPLSMLFLPEPPKEEPVEAQFRRLPGAPELPWSPPMHALARRIRERQAAVVELLDLMEQGSRWTEVREWFRRAPESHLAEQARELLGVSLAEQHSWLDRQGYTPLRVWVDQVESLGIFVMQDGSMPVTEMRGFAAPHDVAPVIVLNSKDDPRARAFTLVHELGHLLLSLIGRATTGREAESWCNEFAGEILMPREPFEQSFAATRGPLAGRVEQVALTYGVTPLAAAVQVAHLGLHRRDAVETLIEHIREAGYPERTPGGNYYLNKITWLGPSFIRLVLDAASEQAVTLSNAAGLLDVKVNNFEALRTRLDNRVDSGE